MIAEPGNAKCYFCGGHLKPGLATLPFVAGTNVVVIKHIPAEICGQCGEAILSSEVSRKVDGLLKQAQQSGFEVSILAFAEPMLAMA